MRDGGLLVRQPPVDRPFQPSPGAVQPFLVGDEPAGRVAQHRPGPQQVEDCCPPVSRLMMHCRSRPTRLRTCSACSSVGTTCLAASVGWTPVGRRPDRRSGCPAVADRADHRGAARRNRADQPFVAERQQVLQRPPPRATMMTSTSGRRPARPARASRRRRRPACTRACRVRSRAPASGAGCSRRRPVRGAARTGDQPDHPQERQPLLRTGSNRPSACSLRFSCSS